MGYWEYIPTAIFYLEWVVQLTFCLEIVVKVRLRLRVRVRVRLRVRVRVRVRVNRPTQPRDRRQGARALTEPEPEPEPDPGARPLIPRTTFRYLTTSTDRSSSSTNPTGAG